MTDSQKSKSRRKGHSAITRSVSACHSDPYGEFLFENRDRFPKAYKAYLLEELRLRKFYQEPLTIGKGGLQ